VVLLGFAEKKSPLKIEMVDFWTFRLKTTSKQVRSASAPLGTLSIISKSHLLKKLRVCCYIFLCYLGFAPKGLNPEVASMLGAAVRYRRATAGSSHDDAYPGNSALHTGKI
jgi:hypothetical protein